MSEYFKIWLSKNPDYYKNYYINNREKLLEYYKNYRELNKEKIKQYNKKYMKQYLINKKQKELELKIAKLKSSL